MTTTDTRTSAALRTATPDTASTVERSVVCTSLATAATVDTTSVAVSVSHTDRWRIEFHRLGQPRSTAVFRSVGQVRMALNLSGAPITRATSPAHAAELVMRAVDHVGTDRIAELNLMDRGINVLFMQHAATPEDLARQRAVWSDRRAQACAGAAFRLVGAVEQGTLGVA